MNWIKELLKKLNYMKLDIEVRSCNKYSKELIINGLSILTESTRIVEAKGAYHPLKGDLTREGSLLERGWS